MNPSDDQLIFDSLSGKAGNEEFARLGEKLSESEEFRERFLDHLDIEAFLHSEAKAGSFSEDQEAFFERLEGNHEPDNIVPLQRRQWIRTVTSISAAAACLVVGFVLLSPRSLTAAAALQQMIDATLQAGDRTYSFSVLRGNEDRTSKSGRQIKLEGATVHLRGKDQFVMIEDLADGTGQRITGFDGKQSWTFAGTEPIYVSDDPDSFRRIVPGSKQDLPFFNFHDVLTQLLDGYDIDLFHREARGIRLLRAYKKSKSFRGPREMHIWFDADTGIVQRLDLLPPGARHRDGPRRIRLKLVDQDPLPANFFSHSFHDDEDRPVETEWRRRFR